MAILDRFFQLESIECVSIQCYLSDFRGGPCAPGSEAGGGAAGNGYIAVTAIVAIAAARMLPCQWHSNNSLYKGKPGESRGRKVTGLTDQQVLR